MSILKKLAGDTMIYGVPSIVGRLLNLMLTPIYTYTFHPEVFGIMGNLLAYVAFFQVILTYGMETSFFRFASKSKNPEEIFGTSFLALTGTSILFVLFIALFSNRLAGWAGYEDHSEYVVWMGITVAIDAITSIPFARLRLQERAMRFAVYKMINIGVNIVLNLYWILLCPLLIQNSKLSFLAVFYYPEIGIGYAFLSFLLSSVITLLLFLPELGFRKLIFKKSILFDMLHYGWPILVVGMAGMVTFNIDKILIPELVKNVKDPMYELGVYTAGGKLAILMTLFTQAFRYSFEPFLFAHYKNESSKKVYSVIMNYFVIVGLLIFLGVLLYVDIFKYFIGSSRAGYHEALKVVPWMLLGNLFWGIFYTQSLWYKLTDQTKYGAIFSVIGGAITLLINILLIPVMGYMASALAFFVSSLIITLISYYFGQKHFPVHYDLKKIGFYFIVALSLYFLDLFIDIPSKSIDYIFKTILLFFFLYFIWINEKKDLQGLFHSQPTID